MAVLTASLSSSYSYLFLPSASLSLFSLFIKTRHLSTPRHAPLLLRHIFTPISPKPSLSLSSLRPIHSLTTSLIETKIDNSDSDPEEVLEREVTEEEGESNNEVKLRKKDSGWVKLPSLSVKEKKEIGSYAHSLGKKLKSQQIGKGGVTEAVAIAMVETLEKNELLKIKIHNNCPGELDDAVKHLEELTGSVVVGQIGRTVILYRPSMTKLKAEEKKKHAQAVVSRRRQAFRTSSEIPH